MNPKSAVMAVLVGAGVFGAATLLMSRDRPAEPGAGAPAPVVEAAREPAAEAKREPAAPVEPPKLKPPAPAPAPKSAPAKSPVVAAWAVPVPVIDGREDKVAAWPRAVSVNNAGTRVMVATGRLLDVWEAGTAAPALRHVPKSYRNLYAAPDASRFYVLGSFGFDPLKLEVFGPTGQRTAKWEPALVPKGQFQQFEYAGFHPTTGEMTVGLWADGPKADGVSGLYAIDPTTGQGRPVAKFEKGYDAASCRDLRPLPGGGCAVNFVPVGQSKRAAGVYVIAPDGAFRAPPGVVAPKDVRGLATTADGHHLAVLGEGLRVWDRRDGRCVADWKRPYYYPYACATAGDRLLVAAGSEYERVTTNQWGGVMGSHGRLPVILHLYELPSMKPLGELKPSDFKLPTEVFGFSPDGKKLALAGSGSVAVVDVGTAFAPR